MASASGLDDTAITDTANTPKEPTMNTSRHLKSLAVLATAAVAVLGAAVLATHAPTLEIVQLERVVIVGKRAVEAPTAVAQLPRVVIIGRSTAAAAADFQLAEASQLKAKFV
jgi:hypothetical protein